MDYHHLKILPEYFEAVIEGKKKFEIRKNDRDYKVGDGIFLNEFDGEKYTGESLLVFITYILQGGQYGLEKDYVIMSIEK